MEENVFAELSDEEIQGLYFRRDETAIAETNRKYGRLFTRIAQNIIGSREDAEEIVNDVYLKLWNVIPPQTPNSLMAFGAKITRNLALNRAEFNSAAKRVHSNLCDELDESVPDVPGREADDGELAKLLDTFLRSIDVESRVMFVLRYWNSEPLQAIALRFGCGKARVKSQLYRTRLKLKEYLESAGVTL